MSARDRLLFELTDQSSPPDEYAKRLWEVFNLLDEIIQAMKRAGGFDVEFGEFENSIAVLRDPD